MQLTKPSKPTYLNKPGSPDYLEKTVNEIDIDLVKIDCLYTYVYGFKNRIKLFLNPRLKKILRIRFLQLNFINKVIQLAKNSNLNAENIAYLVLGSIQYVQGRWGRFPSTGPLYELTLKRDDLEQVLSSYAEEIDLMKLIDNPRLIKETADMKFSEFFGKNPTLKNIKLENTVIEEI